MKRIICSILLSVMVCALGCKRHRDGLNIRVQNTATRYTYQATYPLNKTRSLQRYVARTLNNDLPVDQMVDVSTGLPDGGKFKMKASRGMLKIEFDKRNNPSADQKKIVAFTDGISRILKE